MNAEYLARLGLHYNICVEVLAGLESALLVGVVFSFRLSLRVPEISCSALQGTQYNSEKSRTTLWLVYTSQAATKWCTLAGYQFRILKGTNHVRQSPGRCRGFVCMLYVINRTVVIQHKELKVKAILSGVVPDPPNFRIDLSTLQERY